VIESRRNGCGPDPGLESPARELFPHRNGGGGVSTTDHGHVMLNTQLFPTTPAELTATWLTSALRASGAVGSSAVTGFTWCLVAEQGAGGIVGRASLDYDRPEPGAPASVVIKFATSHAPIRTVMHRFGLYRAEVEFYRQLSADAGIPTPRCYYADIDTQSGYFVLVMEDMKDSRPGDPLRPTVPDVEVAVDHIAGFHARWWKHPRLRELDWLVYPEGPAFEARAAGLKLAFSGSVDAVRQRLGSQFPEVLSEASGGFIVNITIPFQTSDTRSPRKFFET